MQIHIAKEIFFKVNICDVIIPFAITQESESKIHPIQSFLTQCSIKKTCKMTPPLKKLIKFAVPGVLALAGCWWIYNHYHRKKNVRDQQEQAGNIVNLTEDDTQKNADEANVVDLVSDLNDCKEGTSIQSLKDDALIASNLTPGQVMRLHRSELTTMEHQEIVSYTEIYYWGQNADKLHGVIGGRNNGYDNQLGFYKQTPNDHIAYRYQIEKVLGKGGYGEVIKAFDHKLNQHVALKMIRNEEAFRLQAEEEINILQQLRKLDKDNTFNVVHMMDTFTFRNHVCMSFELLDMELYELMKRKEFKGFSLTLVKMFALEILQCLYALKRHGIMHCDLKPENILLRQQNTGLDIRVIDFGCSQYEHQHQYPLQTVYYRAPEVLLGGNCGTPVDMWSFGCILAELLTGEILFCSDDNDNDLLACMIELLGMPSQNLLDSSKRTNNFFDIKGYPLYCKVTTLQDGSTQLQGGYTRRGQFRGSPGSKDWVQALKGCEDALFLDFLKKCLTWDPTLRMTPNEAFKHPWI
ncbi:dual specificity tyrosine-phosphorylation-regulated kinase 2-like [Bombina bombina]|uniref:dual specificity tyrosine-phosphorylation-regulated kinase 2-like n=1 Tax=Bombina bombina TaxID=8345 RepID=UPI00235B0ABB|nr:dual specificity tyrosine-phosphorylation-regulated kinase 2-like [Bombina bombina]